MTAMPLLSECPNCRRRYVPSRRLCVICHVETRSSELRKHAKVLSYSILERTGPATLLKPPYVVALVREEGQGATFCAPLLGGVMTLRLGEQVAVRTHEWQLPEGEAFTGIVVEWEGPKSDNIDKGEVEAADAN